MKEKKEVTHPNQKVLHSQGKSSPRNLQKKMLPQGQSALK